MHQKATKFQKPLADNKPWPTCQAQMGIFSLSGQENTMLFGHPWGAGPHGPRFFFLSITPNTQVLSEGDTSSRDTSHHVGKVWHGLALVELEEGWQVNDVLLCQAQFFLEDVPVPVNAALEGGEKKGPRGRAGKQGS